MTKRTSMPRDSFLAESVQLCLCNTPLVCHCRRVAWQPLLVGRCAVVKAGHFVYKAFLSESVPRTWRGNIVRYVIVLLLVILSVGLLSKVHLM